MTAGSGLRGPAETQNIVLSRKTRDVTVMSGANDAGIAATGG
jgi:hypothetical protein